MKKLAFFLILLFVIKTDFLWAQTATNLKGTLKGNTIHLEFSISGQVIEYDGTVTGNERKSKVGNNS